MAPLAFPVPASVDIKGQKFSLDSSENNHHKYWHINIYVDFAAEINDFKKCMLNMSHCFYRWSNQTSEKHSRCSKDNSLSHFRFRQQQQFRPLAGACRKRKYQSLYCGGHQLLNIFLSIDFRSEQRRRLSGGVPDQNRTHGNLLNKRSYNGYNHVFIKRWAWQWCVRWHRDHHNDPRRH